MKAKLEAEARRADEPPLTDRQLGGGYGPVSAWAETDAAVKAARERHFMYLDRILSNPPIPDFDDVRPMPVGWDAQLEDKDGTVTWRGPAGTRFKDYSLGYVKGLDPELNETARLGLSEIAWELFELDRLGMFEEGCGSMSEVPNDPVNNPAHYGGIGNPYQVVEVIHAWGLHTSFALANAVKYIARAGKKDAATYAQDLEKARWYLTWEIEHSQEMQRLRFGEAEK